MGEPLKILLVILLSSVKFVAGPPFAYFDQRYDFTFVETVSYSVVGGMLGVFAFTYFSKPFFWCWHWVRNHYFRVVKKEHKMFSAPEPDQPGIEVHYPSIAQLEVPKKKLFTTRNRRIVSVWKKYGLPGIAFLTPVLLSIPVGTMVAASLVHNRKKIILYMFFSVLFWSLLMTTLFEVFDARNIRDLEHQIMK